jgi:hypothetical protein
MYTALGAAELKQLTRSQRVSNFLGSCWGAFTNGASATDCEPNCTA